MKAKNLSKLLGFSGRFNYESDLYKEDSHSNELKDVIEEPRIRTREGHLDWAMRMYKSGMLFNWSRFDWFTN